MFPDLTTCWRSYILIQSRGKPYIVPVAGHKGPAVNFARLPLPWTRVVAREELLVEGMCRRTIPHKCVCSDPFGRSHRGPLVPPSPEAPSPSSQAIPGRSRKRQARGCTREMLSGCPLSQAAETRPRGLGDYGFLWRPLSFLRSAPKFDRGKRRAEVNLSFWGPRVDKSKSHSKSRLD